MDFSLMDLYWFRLIFWKKKKRHAKKIQVREVETKKIQVKGVKTKKVQVKGVKTKKVQVKEVQAQKRKTKEVQTKKGQYKPNSAKPAQEKPDKQEKEEALKPVLSTWKATLLIMFLLGYDPYSFLDI